jgi:hypothetical protein
MAHSVHRTLYVMRVDDMRTQFRKFAPFEGSIAEPIAEAVE